MGAWAITAACRYAPVVNSPVGGHLCDRAINDDMPAGLNLSQGSHIYKAGSDGYRQATARWNARDAPQPDWIVVPATEKDVATTVRVSRDDAVSRSH